MIGNREASAIAFVAGDSSTRTWNGILLLLNHFKSRGAGIVDAPRGAVGCTFQQAGVMCLASAVTLISHKRRWYA